MFFKHEFYNNRQRNRHGLRVNLNDQISEHHQNNERNTNANTSRIDETFSYGNSNEQTTIETADNIEMETEDITSNVMPIRNHNDSGIEGDFAETQVDSADLSLDKDDQMHSFSSAEEVIEPSEIPNDFSDEIQNTNSDPSSYPQHETTPVSNFTQLNMDADKGDSDHETHSNHDSQANRFLFNIVGRISLDEMRQRYTAVMHATKID